jgi:hypothetical protein
MKSIGVNNLSHLKTIQQHIVRAEVCPERKEDLM